MLVNWFANPRMNNQIYVMQRVYSSSFMEGENTQFPNSRKKSPH